MLKGNLLGVAVSSSGHVSEPYATVSKQQKQSAIPKQYNQ